MCIKFPICYSGNLLLFVSKLVYSLNFKGLVDCEVKERNKPLTQKRAGTLQQSQLKAVDEPTMALQ